MPVLKPTTPHPGESMQDLPPSLEALVRSQGVAPLEDPSILFNTWPGDENDGFEEDIRALRQANPAFTNRP
ncbi:MAG: hypothetical protein ACE15F_19260 [bacterium]